MNTLLATNILLAAIVVCIIILSILLGVILIHVAGTTRRIKHIVTVFDDDVMRARSVLLAVKDMIADKLFGKKK
jgi:hypothetical protein